MKSRLEEMNELPEFREFFESLKNSANYFGATQPMNEQDRVQAINLCIAMAFKAGRSTFENLHSLP